MPHVLELAVIAQRAQAVIEEHADTVLRDTGLTLARYRVLMGVGHADAMLSVEALARRLGLHRTSVRTTVEVLEQRGLVECNRHGSDRRRLMIALTEHGRKVVNEGSRVLGDVDSSRLANELDRVGAHGLWSAPAWA